MSLAEQVVIIQKVLNKKEISLEQAQEMINKSENANGE